MFATPSLGESRYTICLDVSFSAMLIDDLQRRLK